MFCPNIFFSRKDATAVGITFILSKTNMYEINQTGDLMPVIDPYIYASIHHSTMYALDLCSLYILPQEPIQLAHYALT